MRASFLTAVLLQHKQTNEERRQLRQQELSEQLNSNARARLENLPGSHEAPKLKKSNISYKNSDKFPNEPEVNENLIYVGE